MRGPRQPIPDAQLLPQDKRLIRRLMNGGWSAVAIFALTFPVLDFVLARLVDDTLTLLAVRWVVFGVTAVVLTHIFTQRSIHVVARSVASERAARGEAEALAELA